ncbi:hypothetical protein [Flavobacterium lindanitolerans]|uniref:hypothetical protein n=1 Tax=Flavobacterium lindanitolerans TaxID=428988 RepID=UPI0028074D14|nr:hypothetical protein [Flavobacterium lindanitolerans]MDQ7959861.1 hypothetical protein [Flavobacterium lindanitolerans]
MQNRLIEISCAAYQVFYKKLRDKFYEEHFKDQRIINGFALWEIINPKTGKPYSLIFLENSDITNPAYLYRKYLQLVPEHSHNGIINVRVFFNALLYLGIPPLETTDQFNKFSERKKVEDLYNSFLKLYSDEINNYKN